MNQSPTHIRVAPIMKTLNEQVVKSAFEELGLGSESDRAVFLSFAPNPFPIETYETIHLDSTTETLGAGNAELAQSAAGVAQRR